MIPEITDSYKYEEQIMMSPAAVRDQYLSDRSLLSSSIIFLFYYFDILKIIIFDLILKPKIIF